MANPAPTINQINAFNATQGTIIDFNIIGGTELVRSNRIYIYDLSDNSLICTHLYVSTESIHELPPNTDSSIVYESGKSSADFVNGAQYYAQIQTYTDTAGTEGGSGLSVAKMFWCLVDPTLTITAIPSTISTTSYNVSATYTDTSASVVSNIIQQYQFNLYSAVGSLLQSSGVVVGSGTQQGTSDAYDISYNFTGLNVGSSYYVTVDVTTIQGMSVTTQSNTFTVSIDTPTLGEATVVNNACDGYISVTSNLSGEYGGSASGEIASFVTNSVNNVSSLAVNLAPIQDLHGYDSPWVGGAGKNLMPCLKDGTYSGNGVTAVVTNGVATFSGTTTASGNAFSIPLDEEATVPSQSCYLHALNSVQNASISPSFELSTDISNTSMDFALTPINRIFEIPSTRYGVKWDRVRFYLANGVTISGTFAPMICLTNTATSFSPYENICPISGHTEVDVVRTGKNLLPNEKYQLSGINVIIGQADGAYSTYLKAGTYTISAKANAQIGIFYRKSDGTSNIRIAQTSDMPIGTFTVTDDGYYRIWAYNASAVNASDIEWFQLELGSTATDYEPYEGDTYTTTLPETVYGGTLDVVSGELVVDRAMVDLGSLTWSKIATSGSNYWFRASKPDIAIVQLGSIMPNIVCSHYGTLVPNNAYVGNTGVSQIAQAAYVVVCDMTYSDETTFKSAMSGVQLVYELATPQTIQLTPQEIQTLVGTNKVWSDSGDVEITYNIPITNLLVKRQDVADVSGTWLTLYSQPVTQASDMDFTFIDFLNQYGKTYKYALVPLLTQTQSGVEVEVEGGYTVSDEVQSIFDGVFIADATELQKCKANVGYGDVDMNQAVGTITPIGAKYPVVITNSKNQYHNGSITGTIVPDDYYSNGNLSRIDMVNKRNELEQFLTNKRAKIIKDWNSNIWLVMIMENINCTFNNEYGMGIVNFTANWIEVGDPTNQQDLQATGLIDVGGV